MPNLSFDFEIDDEILIIKIIYSKNYNFKEAVNQFSDVYAMIVANLITETCKILENKEMIYYVENDYGIPVTINEYIKMDMPIGRIDFLICFTTKKTPKKPPKFYCCYELHRLYYR